GWGGGWGGRGRRSSATSSRGSTRTNASSSSDSRRRRPLHCARATRSSWPDEGAELSEPLRVPAPDPVVSVENLVVRFGDVEAVRGISFTVEAGEPLRLLGPHGDGKSTTVHLPTTLLRPIRGHAP